MRAAYPTSPRAGKGHRFWACAVKLGTQTRHRFRKARVVRNRRRWANAARRRRAARPDQSMRAAPTGMGNPMFLPSGITATANTLLP